MTYSFSNSDLVAKRWLTCLFKTKKGSKNCEIPPPPYPQKLQREAFSMLIYDKLRF